MIHSSKSFAVNHMSASQIMTYLVGGFKNIPGFSTSKFENPPPLLKTAVVFQVPRYSSPSSILQDTSKHDTQITSNPEVKGPLATKNAKGSSLTTFPKIL